MTRWRVRAVFALAAAALLPTCDAGQGPAGRCRFDEECAEGTVCVAGVRRCRPQSGCVSNKDCGLSYFCDGAASRCLRRGECARDDHCALGAICDAGACRAGCRADGDCNLGTICVDGACVAGRCRAKADCLLRQFCVGFDAGGVGRCVDAPPPLCRRCADRQGGCGAGSVCFGLVDGDAVCGSRCTPELNDAECPNGFACARIVSNLGCANCPADRCNAALGVCACRDERDCGRFTCTNDVCDVAGGACITDADCPPVPCSDDGACVVAFQCAPQGRVCP